MPELVNFAGWAGLAFLLAFLAESMVEYVLGTPFDKIEKLKPFRWALMYVSMGVGVWMALYWRIDLIGTLAEFAEIDIAHSSGGEVLSGLAIGRGASYLHGMIQQYAKRYRWSYERDDNSSELEKTAGGND